MKISAGLLNRSWAETIIDVCVKSGVSTVAIGPGSRSTPLTLAVANRSDIQSHVHFDERGLGFWALGVAKSTGKPVAIITTSGTATANLVPAIMEAHADHVPLIVLTADRPPSLIGTGANQTTIQPHLYHSFVAGEINFDCVKSHEQFPKSAQKIWDLIHLGLRFNLPIHINVPFDEPLYDHSDEAGIPEWTPPDVKHRPIQKLDNQLKKLISNQNGVIVAGQIKQLDDQNALIKFAETTGWPIFPDILSGLRFRSHPNIVNFSDLILDSELRGPLPDSVVVIGHPVLSKSTLNWLRNIPIPILRWTEHPLKLSPEFPTMKSVTAPYTLLNQLSKEWNHPVPSELAQKWTQLKIQPSSSVPMSEDWIGQHIFDQVPTDSVFFISNSLPIRLVNRYSEPCERSVVVHGNRGVSGIDGIISTAIGTLMGHQSQGVLFIGDLAALYDLNGLAQLSACPYPLKILILNNDGGGIFRQLPVANQTPHFNRFFTTPHGLSFRSAADLFNIEYVHVTSESEWMSLSARRLTRHLIVELSPAPITA